MGIVEREDDDVTMEKLDKALGELFEKKVMYLERAQRWGQIRSRCVDDRLHLIHFGVINICKL